MKINYSKKFFKQYGRCDEKIKQAFKQKLVLFEKNKFHPQLNNHQLRGKFSHCRSINITGDWRALFIELENGEIIFFETLGTHSELYD
jgi:addiction module RelE/StbE family toxin